MEINHTEENSNAFVLNLGKSKWKAERIKIKDLRKGVHTIADIEKRNPKAYDGKLEIRPHYQRLFVYSKAKQAKVIESILDGTPLGQMIWVDHGDGTFSCHDGQQRTCSILYFAVGAFSIILDEKTGKELTFEKLREDYPSLAEAFDNYELLVVKGSGDEAEIVRKFEVINTQSEPLSAQEGRNIIYSKGKWLPDAQEAFCLKDSDGPKECKDFVSAKVNRQELLEIALAWITDGTNEGIIDYMRNHYKDDNADELWENFQNVCDWIKEIVGEYWTVNLPASAIRLNRKWGELYKYAQKHGVAFNAEERNAFIDNYIKNTSIGEYTISGLFPYLIKGDENLLSRKKFNEEQKKKVYHIQNGRCACCHKKFEVKNMDAHHIKAQRNGGLTETDNCAMLCPECHGDIHTCKITTDTLLKQMLILCPDREKEINILRNSL